MTAPDIQLVERVAKATYSAFKSPSDLMRYPWDSALSETKSLHMGYAKAAIAACHAEEMLGTLRLLVAAKVEKDEYGKTPRYEELKAQGWTAAHAIIAKVEGQS